MIRKIRPIPGTHPLQGNRSGRELRESKPNLHLIEVKSKKDSQKFIAFSVTLYKKVKPWIRPIDNEIEAKSLQWRDLEGKEHSRCAIGIENVNFSDPDDDWFEVIIWYEDFEETGSDFNGTVTFDFNRLRWCTGGGSKPW